MAFSVPPWLRLPWVQGLLLCAITAAAYAGVLQAGFVFDDYALVVYNEGIRDLGQAGGFFTQDLWQGAAEVTSGYYRPLMTLSLALDWAIAGEAAGLYHLHSLLWHLLAVWALHRLLLGLSGPLPALVGAALFALHPLQSEAVVWVAARNDLMAAALLLGSLVLLRPVGCHPLRIVLGGLLAVAAVLSKESTLLLPMFLLSLDWAEHGRPRGLWRHAVLWAAVAAHLIARALAGVNAAASPPPQGWELLLSKSLHVLATAGGLIVWPWPLSVGRDLQSWGLGPVALSLGLLAGLTVTASLLLGGRRRLTLVGLFWAAMGFAPALLAVADKGLFGERYLYLSLAGLALALASIGAGLPRERHRWLALALLFVLPWGLLIHLRVRDWADDTALWRAALRDTPCSYVEASFGHVLSRGGEREEAVEMFQRSLVSSPPHLEVCPKLMTLAGMLGSPARSVVVAEESIALGCDSPDDMGQYAVYLALDGRWERARAEAAAAEEGDIAGRSSLVLAAADLVRGDCSRYRSLSSAVERDHLEAQVRHLLIYGGYQELAQTIGSETLCGDAPSERGAP
jgi:hypothetical protein